MDDRIIHYFSFSETMQVELERLNSQLKTCATDPEDLKERPIYGKHLFWKHVFRVLKRFEALAGLIIIILILGALNTSSQYLRTLVNDGILDLNHINNLTVYTTEVLNISNSEFGSSVHK